MATTATYRPACDYHAHRRAQYLFVWDRPGTADRTQPLCRACGTDWLYQSALPTAITAIAVWDPKRADDGWYWH